MRQLPKAKPLRQDSYLSGRDDPAAPEQYGSQLQSLVDVELHQPAAEFHNRLEACNLDAMVFARCTSVAQTFTRTLGHIRGDKLDTIQVILDLSGEWSADYDGREASSALGALRVVDMARPFVFKTGDFQTLNLMLPRAALGEAGKLDLHGLVFDEKAPGAGFLASLLRSLWASLDNITVDQGVAAGRAVAALLNGLIVEHSASPPQNLRPFGVIVFGMARDLVDSRLADPNLNPEAIREHLGVSRTTLYALFEKAGGVQTFIQHRRLDAAFDALARADGRSVSEIAFACGYRSAAHFSRAFTARFSRPPSQLLKLRRKGVEPPPASGGVKAVIAWFERMPAR